MFEDMYTTKMTDNKKSLQERFENIKSKRKTSKVIVLCIIIAFTIAFVSMTAVMAIVDSENSVGESDTPLYTQSESDMKLLWPCEEDTVSAPFGKRYGVDHTGIDIVAPMDSKVFASISGTILDVGYDTQYGNYITIESKGDIITMYAHMSTVFVEKNDIIFKGDVIGLVGSTGMSTGPHLHFEVIINGENVDPIELFN